MSPGRHSTGRGAVRPLRRPVEAGGAPVPPPAPAAAPPAPPAPVSAEGSPSARGVVLTRDGWPVTGAAVTVLGAGGGQQTRATTRSDGTFTLDGLAPGPATLLVTAPGHEPQARSVTVPTAARWDVGDLHLQRQDAVEVPPPGRWAIDADHTSLVATAHHLGLSAVTGRLSRLTGTISVAQPFEASSVDVRIEAASIDTGVPQRDAHLRSADFLDVARHPEITYRGAGLAPGPSGGWALDGDLTLLGTARPVRLAVRFTGAGQDPWGGQRIAFHATAQLSRDDFRMDWNQAVGLGVAVFGTTLRVTLDVEAVLQP